MDKPKLTYITAEEAISLIEEKRYLLIHTKALSNIFHYRFAVLRDNSEDTKKEYAIVPQGQDKWNKFIDERFGNPELPWFRHEKGYVYAT